ncbi:hypothetical protein J2755_000243 [Methanohalophilus levihalophilus]|uniref:hypothetical protein n=1 Tax=Methanohalophilus levihalophilus TaxID=1431282 RepID=UPI001AE1DA8E|nr:hypothetical protein [Methanohalophilus levihalophilus]MBP2029323.1 hypothetical protein [Methanohalophilus levihalophilus]
MNQKVVALFLAGIMVMSILPFLFSGGQRQSAPETIEAQSFSSVGGEQINVPLSSLSDGIAVTPSGAVAVQYFDLEEAKKSHLQFVIGNTTVFDTLYGSNVVTRYAASYDEDMWFELHQISPEVVAFSYYISPEQYKGYQVLLRQNGFYTVIGSPIAIGPVNSTEQVIDVISGDIPATTTFDEVLEYAVDGAQLESAGIPDSGADQYYIAWKAIGTQNNNYSRTTVLLNPTEATIGNITEYAASGEENGLMYAINNYGNITEVTITTNASRFFTLTSEPVM